MGRMTLLGAGSVVIGGGTFTTLDPAKKDTSAGLTVGNLKLSQTGAGSGFVVAQSVAAITGKVHFEVTVGFIATGIHGCEIGVSTASHVFGASNDVADSAGTGQAMSDTGTLSKFFGTDPSTIISDPSGGGAGNSARNFETAGTIVWVEVDLVSTPKTIAYGIVGSSADDIVITFTSSGSPVYAAACVFTPGDNITFNFGLSAFARTPTSGFAGF